MNRPQATLQMPPQMSTFAADVDNLYYFIYWLSVISFVVLVGLMLIYVWLYRRRPGLKAQPSGHNTALEIGWTFSPLIVLGYLFVAGFQGYMKMQVAPPDALEIRVIAKQWSWDFIHPNGTAETNTLQIPVHRPVKLIMSSYDVLHAFYVPEFRVKRDVVPGMFSTLWFEATHETGDQPVTLFCAEYCGAPQDPPPERERAAGEFMDRQNSNHSSMLAAINVVSAAQYRTFIELGPPPPPECEGTPNPAACWGEKLRVSAGCAACHSVEAGAISAGPNWTQTWGNTRNFEGGGSAQGDENYIRQSILEPQAHIVQGFTAARMPAGRFSDRQMDALIAYIRSLRQ